MVVYLSCVVKHEIKFYNTIWHLDKSDAAALREKMAIFKKITGTRKQIFTTLIATFGIKPNAHSIGIADRQFTMDILFEKVIGSWL